MRTTRLAVVALLLALVGPAIGLAAPAVALAAPADTPPAYLRLAHLSPDTPTVDPNWRDITRVLLESDKALHNVLTQTRARAMR